MNTELQICRVKISIDTVRLETVLEGKFCVQFCLSGVKSLGFTSDVQNSNKNVIQFKETKMLGIAVRKDALQSSTFDLHLHIKNQPSSDNERKKDQLIGILKIPLISLLTQNGYGEMREYALQLSALNSFITFSCEAKGSKSGQSSQKNQQNSSLQALEGSYSPPSQHSEYLYPSSRKSLQSKEWDELLVHQASFFTQQNHLPKQDSKVLEQRISELEKADLQTLLKDNYRLERLLYIARNERKIESGRHEQELKDMARELSLREAENIQLREELDNVNDKFGQLLDEFSAITREKQELQIALNSQKIVNEKLQLSHDTLSARVKTICGESQTISKLQQQLSIATKSILQLQEQLDAEKQRVHTVQFHNEQLQDKLQKSLEVIEQLQEEIKSKDEVVNICKHYEQRLSQLQEKIDGIEGDQQEQAEFVHRGSYSSYQAQNNQIRIQEDDNSLRRIIEQEFQQSLSLEENVKTSQDYKSNQFFTATTLLDPQRNELQLLQLLTQNLQKEYDDFKKIYREQEEALSYKHKELNHLEKELANMRYEFLLELSHVTALMNQQILENRQLREENLKLRSRQQDHSKQQKVVQKSRESQFATVRTSSSSWKEQLAMNVSERDELKQRCKQLQLDNQVLLKYNLEREQLYEMMMARKCQNSDDIAAQRFENTLKYILEHREQYGSLLRRYGFCQQSHLENTPLVESQRHVVEYADVNASQVINNFPQKIEAESYIQKFDTFRFQSPELLIQSTARGKVLDPIFPNILSQLIDLTRQRENMGMFGFKKDIYKEQKRDQLSSQIRIKIQRLKVILLKHMKPDLRSQCLQLFKELETAIEEYCLS